MSDTDEDEEGPPVELGEGPDVEGAPPARVASRLHYAIEKSEVVRREGETRIRTPEGPRALGDVLEASDEVYFDTRQAFESAVRAVVGTGPVPTVDEGATDDGEPADGDELSDEEPAGNTPDDEP